MWLSGRGGRAHTPQGGQALVPCKWVQGVRCILQRLPGCKEGAWLSPRRAQQPLFPEDQTLQGTG